MTHLESIYAATNDGQQIILDLVPGARVAVDNPKRKFRYRAEERTPSACLLPPKKAGEPWKLADYGIRQEPFSPIDLYMREMGMGQGAFQLAVMQLAERYGVRDELSHAVNRPEFRKRKALPEETDGQFIICTRGGFSEKELRVWGPRVEAKHLLQLGWKAVECVGRAKQGEVLLRYSTDTYPIFVQTCQYVDEQGQERSFQKLYEPLNPEKQFRFQYNGKVPRGYIFGMDALRLKFKENGESKLQEVLLVSGGSDGVNALSMGCQPVWLNSETADLSADDYGRLLKYAERVVNVPDIDETGIRMGRLLALKFIDMATLWLPREKMQLHDNRGRVRKDLKDYVQLYPSKADFQRLVRQALKARFWDSADDKFSISLVRLSYLLSLNGFHAYRNPMVKGGIQLVRVEDSIVTLVALRDISLFLQGWLTERGVGETVIDKTLKSRELTLHLVNSLPEAALDFSSGTATSQWFYLKNQVVEVTAEGIRCRSYRDVACSGHHVWADRRLPFDYRPCQPMFRVSQQLDGQGFDIEVLSTESDVFKFLINTSRIHWRKEMETRFAGDTEAMRAYARDHRFQIDGEGLTPQEVAEQKQSLANKMFALGYLLHQYKRRSSAWAVVLLDSVLNEVDEADGRSGKSLFGFIVGQLTKVLCLEAKSQYFTERPFIFGGMESDTRVVFVDECHKDLDWGFFLGKITGNLTVEKKGIDPYSIPFTESPKFLIGTNYVVKNTDSSTVARMLVVPFSDYYHQQTPKNTYRESRSVRDDLGHDLMTDEYEGWLADVQFVLQCEQFYLSQLPTGRRIEPPMDNVRRRQQRASLGKIFEAWASDYFAPGSPNLDVKLVQANVVTDYLSETGQHSVNKGIFTQKLKAYCEYADHIDCYNPKDVTGNMGDGERWRVKDNGKLIQYIYVRSSQEFHGSTVPAEILLPF